MGSIVFDTLAYANKLKKAGIPAEQAEAIIEVQAEIIGETLATKQDIKELELKIAGVETVLRKDMKELEATLRKDIAESKAETIKWMFGFLIAQTGLIIGMVKMLFKV